MIVYKYNMVPKTQYCNNHTLLVIASQPMLRWSGVSLTFSHNEFLDFEMQADGQNYWQDKPFHSGIKLEVE